MTADGCWTRCGFSEGSQLKMTLIPLLSWCDHFRATHAHGAVHPLHCTHSHFFFVCTSVSKTSSTQVHPYVGYCVAKTRIHFQYPWLHCTNSFHVHPWALACLSPLSICLDSNVPACGWLGSWHGIESPNNARGLHGQAALPGQRHLSCGEGLLSEGQGDTCPLCIRLYL